MIHRVSLALPYLLFALIVLAIVWDGGRAPSAENFDGRSVRVDPVCGMDVGGNLSWRYEGDRYQFCTERCLALFQEAPNHYLRPACLVCKAEGTHRTVDDTRYEATWQGETYAFCSEEHRRAFQSDAAGYFMHTMWGIPLWLYYTSVAFVLVISFGVFEWFAGYIERHESRTVAARRPHDHFAHRTERPRIDLLARPLVRSVLIHPATRFVLRAFAVATFVFIIAAGLFGNQLPSKNIAPILTWTIWWGGLVVLILYLGSTWCYICPWQAIAEWSESVRFWGVRKQGLTLGLKWPKALRSVWPAILLFVALTWVELGFAVTYNPRATAYMALAIAGLAFMSAFVFDRASFCRYGCFVGRIIGLYSNFAPIEVRTKDLQACRTCDTKSCYKGNDRGNACPTHQYLPAMEHNTECLTCMECIKSCEKENVSLFARPWGEDLVHVYRPRADQASLALVLVALTGFHGFTMTGRWLETIRWLETGLGLGHTIAFSIGMLVLVVVPIAIYAALVALSWGVGGYRALGYQAYFVRYAYALLPIALFYHLAHNSEHLLFESQKIIPLASDPFGFGWNLFGTAMITPAPLLSLPTLWLIQVLLVLVGHIYSLYFARRVAGDIFGSAGHVFRSQLPMLAAMVLFSLASLWLLKQPMEMRVSAM